MTCSPCSVYNVSLKFHNVMPKRSLLFTQYISVFLCTSVVSDYCAQWYLVLTGSFCLLLIYGEQKQKTPFSHSRNSASSVFNPASDKCEVTHHTEEVRSRSSTSIVSGPQPPPDTGPQLPCQEQAPAQARLTSDTRVIIKIVFVHRRKLNPESSHKKITQPHWLSSFVSWVKIHDPEEKQQLTSTSEH